MLSERFPAFAAVASGEVRLDSQNVIKKQNALLCPALEVAGSRNRRAGFGVDFLEDILEEAETEADITNGYYLHLDNNRLYVGIR